MDGTISSVNSQGMGGQGGGGIKKIILPLIILLILGGAIFGGASYLRSRSNAIPTPTPFPTPVPTEEPSLTPEATASPTPTGKLKATPTPTKKATPTPTKVASSSASTSSKGLTVKVLNGTTTAGLAASLADYLKGLGYDIAGTGNADTSDYAVTTLNIKASKESLLPTLKSDLATKYSVGSTSATLATSTSYDAEVIIGKQ